MFRLTYIHPLRQELVSKACDCGRRAQARHARSMQLEPGRAILHSQRILAFTSGTAKQIQLNQVGT